VVRMVASAVVRSSPLAGGSFTGLFLGGILWVFYRAREHGGSQCCNLKPRSSKSQIRKRRNEGRELESKGNLTCVEVHENTSTAPS
jgi:hypothetical protein